MYQKKIPENLECGLDVALKVLGGKWKVRIIDCIHMGINRPSSLRRAISGTSDRVIRLQLRELESFGIIQGTVIRQFPPHIEYSLTRLGMTALGIVGILDDWGERHRERILKNMNLRDGN